MSRRRQRFTGRIQPWCKRAKERAIWARAMIFLNLQLFTLTGFLFMFAFVIYTLLIGAFFYGVMDRAKPLLALG